MCSFTSEGMMSCQLQWALIPDITVFACSYSLTKALLGYCRSIENNFPLFLDKIFRKALKAYAALSRCWGLRHGDMGLSAVVQTIWIWQRSGSVGRGSGR